MTKEEFIKELKALNLKWYIVDNDVIRCGNGDCPILALAHSKDIGIGKTNMFFLMVGRELGLSDNDIYEIVNLADDGPANDNNIGILNELFPTGPIK